MTTVVTRGEVVYQCDVCTRRMRTPANKHGLEVMQRCTITHNCRGKLHRVTQVSVINDTPAFPPEVAGVSDWYPRRMLYEHTQHIPELAWTINHNLGTVPIVHAYVNQLNNGTVQLVQQKPTTVAVIDPNTIRVTFSEAVSGYAQCVALSSQSSQQVTVQTDPSPEYVSITGNAGMVTIATLDSTPSISLGVSFVGVGEQDVSLTYAGLTQVVSGGSAWVGTGKAVINGKGYVLRSYSVTNTSPAPVYFNTGAIRDGAGFRILNVDGKTPTPGEVLILLSTPPHASVDKIVNRYVDASSLTGSTPNAYYADGSLYVAPTLIRTVYPHILTI